jgi:hypothetical protein
MTVRNQKIPTDNPRDTCARCKGASAIMLTVADVYRNEDVVCLECWREAERAKEGVR